MPAAMSKIEPKTVIERFKSFYRDLGADTLDEIDSVYAPHIFFKDPIHEIRGINSLHSYFEELCRNLESCRFEYLDELSHHDSTYIKWDMHFKHSKIGTSMITVRGVTQLQTHNDKIVYHEDVYDLGAMLYEHLPLLGATTKWLKRRLATDANTGV